MSTLPPYEVAEIIRHNKSTYVRAVDTKQWDLFVSVLHPSLAASLHNPDGSVSICNGSESRFSRREDYAAFLRKGLEGVSSIHIVGAGELQMAHSESGGEDEVAAVWAVSYQLGSAGVEGVAEVAEIGGGHYHEVWKKVDGQWLIASLKFVTSFKKVL
ncbi:hypothetical protein BJX65DRAFT_314943 [Aspergillus insuetus]